MSITTWLRRLALASLGVGGTVAGAAYLLQRSLRRSLPQVSGGMTLAGLRHSVEIIRDAWGVPHIYAKNEEDLFFAQGFVHAQDRLFQMDANRRVGSGRLSEIVGPPGLETDRFARICDWPGAAQAQCTGIMKDEETRACAEAFSAGVNAFIEKGQLSAEFHLLAYRPQPWSAFDSAVWGTVLAWGLSVNWETELLRWQLAEALGPQKAADLDPGYDDDYPLVLPAGSVGVRLSRALRQAYHRALKEMPLGDAPVGSGLGSNNWVVNGQWTQSGRPILANDPHLPPIFPTLWYENHLVGGRYNVTGFTSPGVPGLIIGHNENVAWGITNAFPDIQDLYVERFHPEDPTRYEVEGRWEPVQEQRELIHVRGKPNPVAITVRHTRHGPIISDLLPDEERHLALRWACHDENNHMRAMLCLCRATDWESFRHGLKDWAFPSQNVVYADTDGNIAYAMPGRVPRRKRGNGFLPVPGWNGEYEWGAWIPPHELPSHLNPQQGYVVTANNRITGDDFPHLLSGEWQPPYRAQRIAELIEELAPLDVPRNASIQNDTVSLLARRFVSLAIPKFLQEPAAQNNPLVRQALKRLQRWNGDMDPHLVAPTLASGWLVCYTRSAMSRALGPELAQELMGAGHLAEFPTQPFHEIAYELALSWLQHNAPQWIGPVQDLLPAALGEALTTLRDELGPDMDEWHWGKLHYVEFKHYLTRLPMLGRLWKPRTFPLGGDGFTVNQAEAGPAFPPDAVNVIASCRMIMDVGAWDNSLSALPGGQSGHPASDHYQDGVEDWLRGRYHPMLFSRDRVERQAKGILVLEPRGEEGSGERT